MYKPYLLRLNKCELIKDMSTIERQSLYYNVPQFQKYSIQDCQTQTSLKRILIFKLFNKHNQFILTVDDSKYFLIDSYPVKAYSLIIIINLQMNSMNGGESGEAPPIENSRYEKTQPVDFSLTYEQFMIIQHNLPKRYALIEHKNIKKGGVVIASAVKLGPEDTQNFSRVSGTVDNTDDIQGRTKRIRIKKVDKFLEEEPLKARKATVNDLPVEDEFGQCHYILAQLKKHKSAFPFLVPVDPKRDGVLNYYDIVKEPMDLSTIQGHLNSGAYTSASQVHAHFNKIWHNSFLFNEKGSLVHKLTVDMEKYYRNLLSNDGYKKTVKMDKIKARVEKDKKSQFGDENEQRKKSEYFGSKDYVYDDMQ